MKRIFSLLVLGIAAVFLVSCSKQDDLKGEYYNVYNGKKGSLIFKIDGDNSFYYPDGTKCSATINKSKEEITYSDKGVKLTLSYKYKTTGKLTYSGSFGSGTVYKKGSEAYKKALKKND